MKLTHLLIAAAALVAPATLLLAAGATAAPAHPGMTTPPACGTSLETWFAPEGDGFAGGAGYVVEFSNIGAACPGMSTMSVDAINPGTGIPHFTIR